MPTAYDELLAAIPPTISGREQIAKRLSGRFDDVRGPLFSAEDFLRLRQEDDAKDAKLRLEWRHTPSATEVYQKRLADYKNNLGRDMSAEAKIALHRELASLNDAERLQAMPEGGAEPKAAAAAATKDEQPVVKKFADMSHDEIAAVIEQRTGKKRHELTSTKFREMRDALIKQDGQTMNPNDTAAIDRAGLAEKEQKYLNPQARIEAYRAAQRAQGKRV